MNNKPLLIFIADDDEADRLLFAEIVTELKINTVVELFIDGVELMKKLNKQHTILPDLLFLDLNMPRKNGLECLKEIRSNEKLKSISIAIYSTSDNQNDLEETFINGANIYITKPSDIEALKKVLEKAVMATYHYQGEEKRKENFLLKI